MNPTFWRGKRVFLTGHTGFKGGWLALWLTDLGAEVHGYALAPPTDPSLFMTAKLPVRLASSTIADIRDVATLTRAMQFAQPELVFHLAAQPLVHQAYAEPVATYAVNVMGTVNVLESVRETPGVKAVVNITSDKCYENRERNLPYQETDPIGGFDPYSSSKGCAELIAAAYRQSFLRPAGIQLATARAGNVIGGGDWAADRLIPDFLRALEREQILTLRSPTAVRPWQHVLEPLAGYLMLGEKLYREGEAFASAWNFGPEPGESRTVQWLVDRLGSQLPGAQWIQAACPLRHEAKMLNLDSSKARNQLGWRSRWNLDKALTMTIAWHQAWSRGQDMAQCSLKQIYEYAATWQPA